MSNTAPLVLLVHDWDGLTEYEEKRAEMLNEMGYNVFAVDLFGQDVRPTKVEDKRQHTGELYKNRDKLQALMAAGLAEAGKLGGNLDNTVVMGYCFGGAAALESARAGMNARGFVTFHGGLKQKVKTMRKLRHQSWFYMVRLIQQSRCPSLRA
ncbi:dienelactone hydrolase family [Vibrio variabilis]|uniref:Dienelactone hydrolase family n=1 Tax=Vibrio variabilis TaxID=990271 RepID=A0ABQ0JKM3_9VIBR|nr:dienelactone hydrolase family [Vibrio variabilis]